MTEPQGFQFTITGYFGEKTLDDVTDFLSDALCSWLHPNLKDGEDCGCSWAMVSQVIPDDEESDSVPVRETASKVEAVE